MVVRIREALARVLPHLLGYAGLTAVVVGVWGLLGWQAGTILTGLPFATFYLAGQALEVVRQLPPKE